MSILVRTTYRLCRRPPPPWAKYSLLFLVWKSIRKFLNVVVIPDIPFNMIRILMYRMLGFRIGKCCQIGMKCYMDDVAPEKTVIEDHVTISYGCYFTVHGPPHAGCNELRICEGTYIGMCVNLIAGKGGMTIGRNCVIGAVPLVRSPFPTTPSPSACRAIAAPYPRIRTDQVDILLINHYAGSARHGMEYRACYLAREWVNLGHRVTIVAASFSHLRIDQPHVSARFVAENIDGIRYVWLKTPSYRGNGAGRILTCSCSSQSCGGYRRRLSRRGRPRPLSPPRLIASRPIPPAGLPAGPRQRSFTKSAISGR